MDEFEHMNEMTQNLSKNVIIKKYNTYDFVHLRFIEFEFLLYFQHFV